MSLPVNIASFLGRIAEEKPHVPALFAPSGRDARGRTRYVHWTWSRFHRETDLLAQGFTLSGMGRGVRTAVMIRPSLEFFAAMFALWKAGAVPILVDPGIGIRRLKECLGEAEPEAFVGIPPAHLARRLLGWARSSVKVTVTTGRRAWLADLTWEEVTKRGREGDPFTPAPTTEDEMAAILFTSGSTGVPKGVVYTHGIFTRQVEMIRSLYDIRPGEVDLPTFPPFALFDPALGMTTVIPDMDPTRPAKVDPRRILQAVEDFGVTNMFGSPALLDTVGRYGEKTGASFPTLRRVISAGAPVTPLILERFCKMLPEGARVVTPYGATECLPVASISSDEILKDTQYLTRNGGGICVGFPAPENTVRILPIDDSPLPEWRDERVLPQGQVGEITVAGPTVTHTYWKRDKANVLAKMAVPNASGQKAVVHRMGDVGYFDAQGRLWFCGRKSHRVETAQGTLHSTPVEEVFNVHPQVVRTALVGVKRGEAIEPVLCVELEPGARNVPWPEIQAGLQALGQVHSHTRTIGTFLPHPGFPVDIRHNAKIGREKLALWAQGKLR